MADAPRRHYAPGDSPADRARRKAAYKLRFERERKRDPYLMFYKTREWRALQKTFIKQFPTCVFCGKPAKQVDHIVPIRKDWSRRLDPSNLRPLCWSCHSSHTLRERNAQRR
jgi:5-methylcytosine-specific restriction endonuclease McrA